MIDNAQALPLYHQVAGILRQRIEDGIYPVGGKLLSEDELAAEFEVSRATIRQAVGELVMEGLVVRRQGRGTFVEARDSGVLQQRFRGSLGDLINESQRAKTRNVDVAHDAPIPLHIAEALQLDSPAGTIVRRTRIMDGQPFALTVTYLPPDLGKAITPAGLRKKALMELLMDSGISLSSASQSIRAQLADLDVCSQIDCELGAAVLFVERIVHDTAGRPVEYVRSWYRGDRYEYAVTLDLAQAEDGNPYRKLALPASRGDGGPGRRRRGRGQRRPRHGVQQLGHGRLRQLAGAVRGGVEQPDHREHGRAQPGERHPRCQLAQHGDPLLDVQPLQPPDLPARGLGHVGQLPALHGDQVGLAQREADVPAQQRVQRRRGVGGGLRQAAARGVQPLADVEQHLRQDGVLAGEVPVDARAGHAHGRPDVVDGDAVIAALGEQRGRGGQDLAAAQPSARPRRVLSCHVLDSTG